VATTVAIEFAASWRPFRKFEEKRDPDQADEDRDSERRGIHISSRDRNGHAAHACFAVIVWIALATSSHLSTISSTIS
jgi:hypothetical protein